MLTVQIDKFVFSTLLMWLQEDGVFTDLATTGPAAATQTSADTDGSPQPPATAPAQPQPAPPASRSTPRKALQG